MRIAPAGTMAVSTLFRGMLRSETLRSFGPSLASRDGGLGAVGTLQRDEAQTQAHRREAQRSQQNAGAHKTHCWVTSDVRTSIEERSGIVRPPLLGLSRDDLLTRRTGTAFIGMPCRAVVAAICTSFGAVTLFHDATNGQVRASFPKKNPPKGFE